jgi:hypothetical protein
MTPTPSDDALIADLATGLWRLRRRFIDSAASEQRVDVARPLRDAEALLARLAEEGIDIQDHSGQRYDATLSLRVAAFQPTSGLAEERILETLKPTVYRRGERIQIGEVIVGIPDTQSR